MKNKCSSRAVNTKVEGKGTAKERKMKEPASKENKDTKKFLEKYCN